MQRELSPNARRVQDALTNAGLSCQVQELPASTRTAQEAAAAVGCTVAQIAKSLVFRGTTTASPYLVIASGAHRVNEHRLGTWVAEPVEKPDAAFVRAATGFPIGGVPPLGHDHASRHARRRRGCRPGCTAATAGNRRSARHRPPPAGRRTRHRRYSRIASRSPRRRSRAPGAASAAPPATAVRPPGWPGSAPPPPARRRHGRRGSNWRRGRD